MGGLYHKITAPDFSNCPPITFAAGGTIHGGPAIVTSTDLNVGGDVSADNVSVPVGRVYCKSIFNTGGGGPGSDQITMDQGGIFDAGTIQAGTFVPTTPVAPLTPDTFPGLFGLDADTTNSILFMRQRINDLEARLKTLGLLPT